MILIIDKILNKHLRYYRTKVFKKRMNCNKVNVICKGKVYVKSSMISIGQDGQICPIVTFGGDGFIYIDNKIYHLFVLPLQDKINYPLKINLYISGFFKIYTGSYEKMVICQHVEAGETVLIYNIKNEVYFGNEKTSGTYATAI